MQAERDLRIAVGRVAGCPVVRQGGPAGRVHKANIMRSAVERQGSIDEHCEALQGNLWISRG